MAPSPQLDSFVSRPQFYADNVSGLIAMVIVALVIATVLWVMAARIETGQTQPNMGHHTQQTTTPASWSQMQSAMAEAMRSSARLHLYAVAAGLGWAAWSSSGSRGAGVVGIGIGIAEVLLVAGILRASGLLVDNGSITR